MRIAAALSAVALAASINVLAEPVAAAAYAPTTLHFRVLVGHAGAEVCNIVGDLYVPDAVPANGAPAILTTNGFGGDRFGQAGFAQEYRTRGYVVLSYSGLGFGGSGCKITLDDPDWDGRAASQLVSFLGGAPGIAFADAAHTVPVAPLTAVRHDPVDHNGVRQAHDPRVGMWGGYYGGQVQFAAASVDARIDAINPQITWNDLSYSLGPNNAYQYAGVSTRTPGAVKSSWAVGFSLEGVRDGVTYVQDDPSRLIGCPNFADWVCPALVQGAAYGQLTFEIVPIMRHASVASYYDKIKIPVLLDQGINDTLFNLNEAVATYRALKAQGNWVRMMWRSQGHSGGTPTAAGRAYEDARILAFFEQFLNNGPAVPQPEFAYYREWTGDWATAGAYPVGAPRALHLAGTALADAPALLAQQQSFLTPVAGVPTSTYPLEAIGGLVHLPVPDQDLPGTFAAWTGAPLATALDVVGSPVLDLRVSAPTTAVTPLTGPAGQLVVFAKLYDVAPDGTATRIHGQVAPVRVPDVTKPTKVTLPAIAHRFEPGHRLKLVIAGGDLNYRGNLVASAVTVSNRTSLTLPVV